MAITPEQIVESLMELSGEMVGELYEHKCDNADNFNAQRQEIQEQINQMTGSAKPFLEFPSNNSRLLGIPSSGDQIRSLHREPKPEIEQPSTQYEQELKEERLHQADIAHGLEKPEALDPILLEACKKYQKVSEKAKDCLTGDTCSDIGLYELDVIVEAAITKAESQLSHQE